jgi:glutathione S-transferase/maleylpyruvate isomerase
MLTIYTVPVALYCAKLRIMMRHKGVEWQDSPPPGGYGSAEYRAIVPSGNLPAMIHDGFMLADSEAIAEYLEEAFPEIPMMPQGVQLRAKAREQSRLHDTRLEPAVRALYPHVAYATRDPSAIAEGGVQISKHLASLALLLRSSPLPRDELLLCDCGFAVCFAWINAFEIDLGIIVDWPQDVLDYASRIGEFAAVRDELNAYRPAMEAYLQKARPTVS